MDSRIIITLGGDAEEVTLTVDVDDTIDFLTALGALEAAKTQYVQSKFRRTLDSELREPS